MILGISILIIIIGIYYLLDWLYQRYKSDLKELDDQRIELQLQIRTLNDKIKVQEQLINWLYDNIDGGKKNGK